MVCPHESDGGVWINQDAVFSLAHTKANTVISYQNKYKNNGIYLMIINGDAEVNNNLLHKRDAIEITGTNEFSIKSISDTDLLAIEVPVS